MPTSTIQEQLLRLLLKETKVAAVKPKQDLQLGVGLDA